MPLLKAKVAIAVLTQSQERTRSQAVLTGPDLLLGADPIGCCLLHVVQGDPLFGSPDIWVRIRGQGAGVKD